MSIDIPVVASHIRKVNVRQDLLPVADLIELCFASTLDADGREYLRHLRWAARDAQYLSWLQGAAERLSTPLYGFVWEEQDRLVGNLSLIPLYRNGRLVYLIANVAVHPDFRQRGIARKLTQRALEYLRERGISSAWLQVRDDNPVAQRLYLECGFVERARRTTWLSGFHHLAAPSLPAGLVIGPRRREDWSLQARWLKENYPTTVSWNLPLSIHRLDPGLLNRLLQMARGASQSHWAASRDGRALGFITWEPQRSASDMLWLAASPPHEDEIVQPLVAHAYLSLLRRGRSLAINYPAGRAAAGFQAAGFAAHQTLIWMEAELD